MFGHGRIHLCILVEAAQEPVSCLRPPGDTGSNILTPLLVGTERGVLRSVSGSQLEDDLPLKHLKVAFHFILNICGVDVSTKMLASDTVFL